MLKTVASYMLSHVSSSFRDSYTSLGCQTDVFMQLYTAPWSSTETALDMTLRNGGPEIASNPRKTLTVVIAEKYNTVCRMKLNNYTLIMH